MHPGGQVSEGTSEVTGLQTEADQPPVKPTELVPGRGGGALQVSDPSPPQHPFQAHPSGLLV